MRAGTGGTIPALPYRRFTGDGPPDKLAGLRLSSARGYPSPPVLPQFAPQGHGMLSRLVLLGLAFASLTFVWLALYASIIAAAGAFMRASR
jgi:hypothetical protein